MSGPSFELGGRASELLASVRPGIDHRSLAKVAVHLTRMMGSGLPMSLVQGAMSKEARALLSVTFDEVLKRPVARPLHVTAKEGRQGTEDSRSLVAKAFAARHSPTVNNRPDGGFSRELSSVPPQSVALRLQALMSRPGSVAAISTNPVREGWLTYDEDSRLSRVHCDTATGLLRDNGFAVIPVPEASTIQLTSCDGSSDSGLLVVRHDLFTAHREGVNRSGGRVVRDVRICLEEAFAVDLNSVAANLGVGAESLFGTHADDAKLLLTMAADERDANIVTPVASVLVAEHYAKAAA